MEQFCKGGEEPSLFFDMLPKTQFNCIILNSIVTRLYEVDMNVKQFLYSFRDEQTEIDELNDRIYELEMSLLPSGIRYDQEKVQTSPSD